MKACTEEKGRRGGGLEGESGGREGGKESWDSIICVF